MEEIITYRGVLDGKPYICLYRKARHKSGEVYEDYTMMVPGSWIWESDENKIDQKESAAL
jgi:hypothetical protein